MAEFKSPRRYYLLKRIAAKAEDDGLEGVWRHKQEQESGTALPANFPLRATLVAAGYSTEEDLDGADAAELTKNTGLSTHQANAVLTAAADL